MRETEVDIVKEQKEYKVDEERKWCVYCHTNKINGKKYFGITSKKPEKRWGKNGNEYSVKAHPVFGKAIKKYGWDNFEHKILFENLSKEQACKKEVELIALYKTNCTKYNNPTFGYNMSDGGESGSAGMVWSDEARQRLSKILTGRIVSDETRQKIKEIRTGVPLSEYHRQRLSESHMGNTSPRKGVSLNDDTKSKISQSKRDQHNGFSIYCIELSQIFYSSQDANRQTNIDASAIIKCCRGKQSYAGKNVLQKQYFHWLYVKDHIEQDGTVIQGAITLGYVTQTDLDTYLENLKQKEIDT